MINFSLKDKRGFSLVETLVAITILLLVIVSPMRISTRTSNSTSFSSEQVVALFLAQEGAELAQSIRDDFVLQTMSSDPSTGWNNFANTAGVLSTCYTASGCGLELNTDTNGSFKTPAVCASTGCPLYYGATSGRSVYTYTSSGADATPYKRTIKMSRLDASQVRVESVVTWRTGSQIQDQEVKTVTYLFNVYGG